MQLPDLSRPIPPGPLSRDLADELTRVLRLVIEFLNNFDGIAPIERHGWKLGVNNSGPGLPLVNLSGGTILASVGFASGTFTGGRVTGQDFWPTVGQAVRVDGLTGLATGVTTLSGTVASLPDPFSFTMAVDPAQVAGTLGGGWVSQVGGYAGNAFPFAGTQVTAPTALTCDASTGIYWDHYQSLLKLLPANRLQPGVINCDNYQSMGSGIKVFDQVASRGGFELSDPTIEQDSPFFRMALLAGGSHDHRACRLSMVESSSYAASLLLYQRASDVLNDGRSQPASTNGPGLVVGDVFTQSGALISWGYGQIAATVFWSNAASGGSGTGSQYLSGITGSFTNAAITVTGGVITAAISGTDNSVVARLWGGF